MFYLIGKSEKTRRDVALVAIDGNLLVTDDIAHRGAFSVSGDDFQMVVKKSYIECSNVSEERLEMSSTDEAMSLLCEKPYKHTGIYIVKNIVAVEYDIFYNGEFVTSESEDIVFDDDDELKYNGRALIKKERSGYYYYA